MFICHLKTLTMKHLTVLFFLSFSALIYSQSIKDALQGDWVCTQIIDSAGNKTIGKFGYSDEFLKFSFVKNSMFLIEAPFDKGIKLLLEYGKDYIDLFPGAIYELPERKYTIKSIDESNLVLTTKNTEKQLIEYHFTNQADIKVDLSDENRFMDIGSIAIKHHKPDKDSHGANRVSEYKISNNKANFRVCPKFIDSESACFGDYFSINFKFPDSYKLDEISDELIVDFNVTGEGAQDIKIIKGLNEEMDASFIKTFEGTTKKWKPVIIDGKAVNTKLRLHFVFYLGFTQMPNIFIE